MISLHNRHSSTPIREVARSAPQTVRTAFRYTTIFLAGHSIRCGARKRDGART